MKYVHSETFEFPDSLVELDIEEERVYTSVLRPAEYKCYLKCLPLLHNLRELKLSRCNLLTELPMFPALEKVTINECAKLRTLPCWSTVTYVDCSKNNLQELPCWPSVVDVNCTWSTQITALPDWPNVTKAHIVDCHELAQIPNWTTIKDVTVYDCPEIRELPCWPNVETVRFGRTDNDVRLPSWPSIIELVIVKSYELTSIPSLNTLRKVLISDCYKLMEIPMYPELIELKCWDTPITRFPILLNLQLFDASKGKAQTIPCYENVKELKCEYFNKLEHIPAFPTIESLNIQGCDQLQELPYMPSLKNIRLPSQRLRYPSIMPADVRCACIRGKCSPKCGWLDYRTEKAITDVFNRFVRENATPYVKRVRAYLIPIHPQ